MGRRLFGTALKRLVAVFKLMAAPFHPIICTKAGATTSIGMLNSSLGPCLPDGDSKLSGAVARIGSIR